MATARGAGENTLGFHAPPYFLALFRELGRTQLPVAQASAFSFPVRPAQYKGQIQGPSEGWPHRRR